MRKLVLAVGLSFLALAGLGACRATVVHRHGPGPDYKVVVGPPKGHHCHAGCGCGHVWHDGKWHHNHAHKHGPGCGHHWDGHRWIIVVK